MNKHLRRGHAGFSMVELLVTIIIAGLCFAALVPVFINAQKLSAKDQARTAAANVAQDALERIRQLPWSVISTSNLLTQSTALGLPWATTPSGSPTHWTTTDGGRTYTITPSVTTVSSRKIVKLTISWTQSGSPKSLVVSAGMFQQLPGPQIVDLTFAPAPDSAPPSNGNWIRTLPALGAGITIGATINPAQQTMVGYVKFTVSDMSGRNAPITVQVSTPDSGTSNKFSFSTWGLTTDATKTLKDGLYRVRAMAYPTGSGLPGTPWVRDIRIETETPPALNNVHVYAGTVSPAQVNITWDPSASADWAYYEIWRRESSGASWTNISGDSGIRGLGFRDLGVTAGHTYDYVIRAVDTAGNCLPLPPSGTSPEPLTVYSATPTTAGPATSAPNAPQNLTVSFVGSAVVVAWQPPSNAIGIVGYHVYHVPTTMHSSDSAAAMFAVTAAPSTEIRVFDLIGTPYPAFIAFNTAYCYTVKSFNAEGVESPVASLATGQLPDKSGTGTWAKITTPASAIYTLKIYVQNLASTKSTTVNIINLSTGAPAVTPLPVVSKTSPYASVNLPYGVYVVSVGTKSATATLTGDAAVPVYVSLAL